MASGFLKSQCCTAARWMIFLLQRMKQTDKETNCLYTRWKAMHQRCKSNRGNYGELNISVCPEWSGENGFENFKRWSLNNHFSPELVLDRKNTYSSYSPENCRWISQKENNRNKTTTVFVEDGTERLPLSSYCEKHGLGKTEYMRLYMRIRRNPNAETHL